MTDILHHSVKFCPNRKTRKALHVAADHLTQMIVSLADGVYPDETVKMLRSHALGLKDIIDGDPVGTFERWNEQF